MVCTRVLYDEQSDNHTDRSEVNGGPMLAPLSPHRDNRQAAV